MPPRSALRRGEQSLRGGRSACVAMALDDAIEQGKARPGDLIVIVGSGVGYNQAAVAFRMPSD